MAPRTSRWVRGLLLAAPLGLVIPACSSTPAVDPDAGLPPAICKKPSAPSGAWFHEVTSEVGLATTPTFQPIGAISVAADLDGDGFVDLLVAIGSSARGPYTWKTGEPPIPGRFVLMNRPDPKDAKKRIFVDTSATAGLTATRDGAGDRGYGIMNLGDLDGDGDVDALLCPAEQTTTARPILDACDAFLNDGKAHFTLAPSSELNAKSFWVTSGALLDYDRDGILDYWPGTVAHWPYEPTYPNQPPTLFRGNGDGTFHNASAEVGLPTKDGLVADGTQFRHVFGVTACDLDGDGDDDMVFASYGREENQVWRNDGGTFVNVAHELGLDYDDRMDYLDDQSYRCFCADVNNKCSPQPPPPDVSTCNVFGNPYFRGWGNSSTKPYSLRDNYFTIACGDADDDGDLDLMRATIVHGDCGAACDPSELILNPGDGSKFTRPGNVATGLDRPETGVDWNHGDDMAVFADLDLDGRKDIFMTTTGAYEPADRTHLWHQKTDGTYEEIATTSGLLENKGSYFSPNMQGPAFVDIDGDGDLDLVVGGTVAPSPLHVYRNDIGQDSNWLRVRLVGKGAGGANVSGIGARVRVKAGGRTQTQELQGGYGHSNVENDLVLTFGLGGACDVDSIEVLWPNGEGTTSTFGKARANYTVEIREGETTVRYLGLGK